MENNDSFCKKAFLKMSMYPFLSSLPAILGAVTFVIYLLLKKSITKDETIIKIIDTLKRKEPNFAKEWNDLSSKARENLILNSSLIKERINNSDRQIFERIISNQFRTNIFVYSICALLVLAGLYFMSRPKDLYVDSIQIQNTDSTSTEQRVDIDPLTITWTYTGQDEELFVALENVATGKQSTRQRVLASDGKIKIESDPYDNYDKILSDRQPNSYNRIRAVIYSKSESFKSQEFEIRVGVKIIAYNEKPEKVGFYAVVDSRIIDSFHFAPSLALFKDTQFNGRAIFEARSFSSRPYFYIPDPKKYTTSNLVFNVNPRDIINKSVYRIDVESLREAIKSLQ